jgi:hypothetical protein
MYAQLLIAVSFVIASYQDVTERAVSDLVWAPAAVGIAYGVYYAFSNFTTAGFEFLLVKVALVGGVALAFTYFGGIGQADAIAMAAISGDPNPQSPFLPLFFAAGVALVHIGYEVAVGNARGTRTIPMEQFLKEQRWIPKAIVSEGTRTEVSGDVNVAREEVEAANKPGAQVEVKYGVPTVAYLGLGFVAYVAYLFIFNFGALSTLA